MANIDVTQLTNASAGSPGTGVFDVMIDAVELRINAQHTEGRITGSDFAQVYLGGLQSTLQQAVQFLLGQQEADKKADLLAAQIDTAVAATAKTYGELALVEQRQETEKANTTDATGGQMKAKQDLMAAQTLGFASDTKQKVLKQMLEGYAVNLSISGSADVPETVLDSSIDQLSQEILTDIGSSVDIQSSAQAIPVGN